MNALCSSAMNGYCCLVILGVWNIINMLRHFFRLFLYFPGLLIHSRIARLTCIVCQTTHKKSLSIYTAMAAESVLVPASSVHPGSGTCRFPVRASSPVSAKTTTSFKSTVRFTVFLKTISSSHQWAKQETLERFTQAGATDQL